MIVKALCVHNKSKYKQGIQLLNSIQGFDQRDWQKTISCSECPGDVHTVYNPNLHKKDSCSENMADVYYD